MILNFSNSFFQAKADRLQTYPKFLPIRYHTQPQYTSSHPFSPSSKITARRLHPIHHFIHFTTKYTSQAFSYALPHPQGGAKLACIQLRIWYNLDRAVELADVLCERGARAEGGEEGCEMHVGWWVGVVGYLLLIGFGMWGCCWCGYLNMSIYYMCSQTSPPSLYLHTTHVHGYLAHLQLLFPSLPITSPHHPPTSHVQAGPFPHTTPIVSARSRPLSKVSPYLGI